MSGGPMLREVKVQDAIGMMLAHDLTQIIPGQFKGRKFKKGHVIREADIDGLLDIGKEHIYVMDLADGWLHEEEAALRIARAAAGEGVELSEPHEGKVTLRASRSGLAKVSREFTDELNAIDQIVFSTIRSDRVVQEKHPLVGTRVVPLVTDSARIELVESIAQRYRASGVVPVEVKPFHPLRVGLVTTGSEVFSGRIQDRFGPVVREKVAALGSEVAGQRFTPDDSDEIVSRIREFMDEGVDLILVTGGMSVDPDDRTPGAIRKAGADIISYGTPMLPGSMLMIAYLNEGSLPIMGLPGCVIHDPFTAFDVLLPRICAGERIARSDITAMGYGGLYGC